MAVDRRIDGHEIRAVNFVFPACVRTYSPRRQWLPENP
ncbi:Hypothetical protein A7982_05063 [Minicystis rosea]|nr:Hypothetical protein A7982_05063 [Minicystis rosea]